MKIHFMNGAARSFDAGLSLAALARLGGAVDKAQREGVRAQSAIPSAPCPGVQPLRRPPPVSATSGFGSSRWSSIAHLAPKQPSAREPREPADTRACGACGACGAPAAQRRRRRA
jgi:hypothetical protein